MSDPTSAAPPEAPLRTESFRKERPSIVGPEIPEAPYPIRLSGTIQRGFGRGGRDLGCHTANLPDDALEPITSVAKTGIYYGFAKVYEDHEGTEEKGTFAPEDLIVLPMVMSLGWNPYYKNEKLTAEVHIMHKFPTDFYGHFLDVLVLGYIRPELDYTSRDALIEDIQTDIRVAHTSLARPAYDELRSVLSTKPQPKSS
ncbi:riboflavin kinase [Clavulina sp. PMI_390]|nr:riboflavin kinase [Clavulina sp. PMI_390]